LLIVMVTLPDFAVRDEVLNLNAPLGSAETLRPPEAEPPPPPLLVEVVWAGGGALAALEVVFFLLLPHPATAIASEHIETAAITRLRFIAPPGA
jgi:hypothetical protein